MKLFEPRRVYEPGFNMDKYGYDWLNKFYSFYMAAVVVIGSGCGLRIEVRRGN